MEARIKIPQLTQKYKPLLDNFGRQSFTPYVFTGESVSNHNIALFTFDYEVWFNEWKNIVHHWASRLPVINGAIKLLLTRPSISRIFRTTESIFKPYYEFLIATRYLKHTVPLKAVSIFTLFYMANIEASFPVYQSRQISDLPGLVMCSEFYNFSHYSSLVSNNIILNEEKVHRERLNEMALERGMRKSELLSKDAEENPKRFSRLEIGH